jgi:uncharacterized membrane-anchored protein
MPQSGANVFQLHPLREALYNELHVRPFYSLESPQKITHLAAHCEQPELLDRSYDRLCELCQRYNVNAPAADALTFYQDFGDFTINWERHVEFFSLTIMQSVAVTEEPFQHNAIDLLPDDWLTQLPGQVIAAYHLVVDAGQLRYTPDTLARFFEGQSIVLGGAYGGKAHIYTAFKLHGDGYGRYLIHNQGISNQQTGRLVRRLIDLETYRLLALLALPVAKRISPDLLQIDKQLATILANVTDVDSRQSERDLLAELIKIEARLETFRADTTHRFSATRAYHQLVKDRLERINEKKIDEHLSISEFINRRFNPALRTCDSVQKWLEDLSIRIERASDLMRTRVNLNLQEQNRSQLTAMNRRSQLQFRLQETVEGLSIAAISYYAVGLLSYLFNGLPLNKWGIDKDVLLAGSIPLVLIIIWSITRRIKRRLIKDQEKHD